MDRVSSHGFLKGTLVATCVLSLSCSAGTIGDRGQEPGGGTNPGGGTTNPGGGTTNPGGGTTNPPQVPPSTEPPPMGFAPVPAGLRRLTVPQYQNSLRDLLGDVTIPPDLDPDTVLNGFASVGAARVSLAPHTTEQFETVSLDVASQVLGNSTRRTALVGCTPAGMTDDACVRQFVTKFGRRAWRRPLAEEEITLLVGVAKNAQMVLGDFWKGLEYGLSALLQSPQFLYRYEVGTPDPGNSARVIFSDWELATRLSYLLWNTTPDDQLLDAAAARQLTTGGGLLTQVDRLLASPRARPAMGTFFTEMYRLGDLDELPQSPTAFPQVTATLGASMRGESLRVLEDLAFGVDMDFRNLFFSSTTFVNAELAKLYKLPAPAGVDFTKVTLPPTSMRVGFLGQAGFLASNAHAATSSPTLRGKFVREVLLCQAIPPPPPNVVTTLPADTAMGPRTMRQKLEVHRMTAGCASCHAAMDPIGLGLENFDGIGAERTMDAGQVIDASGDLDGVAFSGPRELALALQKHPEVAQCLARSLYRYTTGHVEGASEEPAIKTLTQAFETDGYRFRSLVTGMIRSAAFVYAAPAQ